MIEPFSRAANLTKLLGQGDWSNPTPNVNPMNDLGLDSHASTASFRTKDGSVE